jgi:hypothetical protein
MKDCPCGCNIGVGNCDCCLYKPFSPLDYANYCEHYYNKTGWTPYRINILEHLRHKNNVKPSTI